MSSANMLFMSIMSVGPIITLCSPNWVMCWVGLELNFLGVLPILLKTELNFMSLSKESVMKYFFIQSMGSGMLMLSGLTIFMGYCNQYLYMLLLSMGLFSKLGVFPMHFWVPSVLSGLSWMSFLLISTVQKIGPFGLLLCVCDSSLFLKYLVLFCATISTIMGCLIGLNQSNLRAMLGSSSISHTGWCCFGVMAGGLWSYFFIYCTGLMILVFSFWLKDMVISSMMILSLSGIPPFMMFIGKWIIIKCYLILNSFSVLVLFIPVASTFLSIFFYLKFCYSYFMMSGSLKFNNLMYNMYYIVISSGVLYMSIY